MRLSIANLGALTKAEIDIKPLTVFVGPNNTGKTWTASIVAAIMSQHGWKDYSDAYSKNETSQKFTEIENAANQILQEGNAKIDLIEFFNSNGLKYFNDAAKSTIKSTNIILGTRKLFFGKTKIKIEFNDMEINEIRKNLLNNVVKIRMGIGKSKKALLTAIKERKSPILYFFTTERDIPEKIPEGGIKDFINMSVFRICHSAYFHNIYFFPSERTGLMTIFLDVSPMRGRKRDIPPEDSEDNKKELLLSAACGDLISTMENIKRYGNFDKRLQEAKKNIYVAKYLELVEILQKEILQGRIDYARPEPQLPPKVLYTLNDNQKIILEMTAVSSMVKDFAPIILYLRYFARKGDLILIDEPEMNLHPESQVKLIEFLAMLVNAGIYVIVTTHSSYIVDHLTNLMKAAKNKDPTSIQEKFYLKNTEAFIPQTKVSVYLFGNNTAKDILTKEGSIDWETFSSVAEHVSEIYFDI